MVLVVDVVDVVDVDVVDVVEGAEVVGSSVSSVVEPLVPPDSSEPLQDAKTRPATIASAYIVRRFMAVIMLQSGAGSGDDDGRSRRRSIRHGPGVAGRVR